ncbi:MAG TPA: NADH-quinone oxidoreductase subunit K [bacterium]|nr:NADH-quinone oxidoreductase subunit K [bacterium]
MLYLLCFALFLVGLFGVLAKKNLVKIIIGFAIMEYAIHLLIVMLGYRDGGRAAVLVPGATTEQLAASGVDPLAQAMVLISIVIGLSILVMLVALCIRLYERHGTFDLNELRNLKG